MLIRDAAVEIVQQPAGVGHIAPLPNVLDPPEASAGFPPDAWLGRGLDLTTAMPGDIGSITRAIKSAARFIKPDDETKTRMFNSGVTWKVPNNVNASEDVRIGQSNYNAYRSGTEAANAFQADASLTGKYMAVSGSVSVGASISKMFNKDYSYALFSYNANLINVFFKDWADHIDEDHLKKRLKHLGTFDARKPDAKVVSKWKNFFRAMGTHVVTGCAYGARFQLMVWASNESSSAKEKFSANVSAEYNGLTTGGKFDGSVTNTSDYKTFQSTVQKTCSCQGGDPRMAVTISGHPNDKNICKHYNDWVDTTGTMPNIMSMQTVALWEVLAASMDDELVDLSPSVEDVFRYIVAHPGVHKTKCRFVISSDWGEFGLLTPSAIIRPDEENPAGKDFLISPTKVSWGKEHSFNCQRTITVDFVIENDGSPVDIVLSHGSNGDTPGNGRCTVRINGKDYVNKEISGNNWNSLWFYGCVVQQYEA